MEGQYQSIQNLDHEWSFVSPRAVWVLSWSKCGETSLESHLKKNHCAPWKVLCNVWMCNVSTGSCVGNIGLQLVILYERLWIFSEVEAGWMKQILGEGVLESYSMPMLTACSLLPDSARCGKAESGQHWHSQEQPHPPCFTYHDGLHPKGKVIDTMVRRREYTFFHNHSWVHSQGRIL